jgi:hypothetical protein
LSPSPPPLPSPPLLSPPPPYPPPRLSPAILPPRRQRSPQRQMRRLRSPRSPLRHRNHRSGHHGQLPTPPPIFPPASALVADRATSLGITFSRRNHEAPVSPVDWTRRMQAVVETRDKISRMHCLSMFGRAFASAGYSLSTILYHAEFGGMPPEAQLQEVIKKEAELVDGRCMRAGQRHPVRLTGVSAEKQVGPPSQGGFGVLPLREHIRARHARWGLRLACSGTTPPDQLKWWVRAARELLRRRHMCDLPVQPFMLLSECGTSLTEPTCLSQPAPPQGTVLRRLIDGLRSLPPPISTHMPPAGPWCIVIPLWCNPWLDSVATLPAPHRTLFHAFGTVHVRTNGQVTTVGEAIRLRIQARENSGTQQQWVAWLHVTWPFRLDPSLQGDRMGFLAELEALVDALPLNIVAAACIHHNQQLPDPASDLALEVMQENLGWRVGGQGMLPRFMQVDSVTIKQATAIQLQPLAAKRKGWHAEYAGVAIEGSLGAPVVEAATTQVQALLATAWRLRWENRFKETLWRVTVNGARHMGNSATQTQQPTRCFCSTAQEPRWCCRAHHYHECPVAQAVFGELRSTLAAGGGGGEGGGGGRGSGDGGGGEAALSRHHVWLGQSPGACVSSVWQVVCLAAFTAMETGRQRLAALGLARLEPEGRRQTLITAYFAPVLAPGAEPPPPLPPPRTLVEVASAAAVAQFWAALHSFARLGVHGQRRKVAARMQTEATPTHPFLGVQEDGSIVVNGGPDAAV